MATCLSPPGGGKTTKPFCTVSILPAPAFRRSLQVLASRRSFCSVKDSGRPISQNKWEAPSFVSVLRYALENPSSSRRTANAVEEDSTSAIADADRPSFPVEKAQGEENVVEYEENVVEYEERESVGMAGSKIIQERQQRPSKTEQFWRGVLEEIELIEWPPLQKVLGTTGVVTGIIIGSSIVLVTVNAFLARLSDAIFNNAPPA